MHKSPLKFYQFYRNNTSSQQNDHTNAKNYISSSWSGLNTRLEGFRNNIYEENISNKNISRSFWSQTLRRKPLEIGEAHQEKGRNCEEQKKSQWNTMSSTEKLLCSCRASLHSGWLSTPSAHLTSAEAGRSEKQQTQNASQRKPPRHTEPQHPQSNDSSDGLKSL